MRCSGVFCGSILSGRRESTAIQRMFDARDGSDEGGFVAGVLGGDGAIDEPIGRASSVVVSFPGVALAAAAMVKGLPGVKCFAQRCVRPPVAPTRAATTMAAMRVTRAVRDGAHEEPEHRRAEERRREHAAGLRPKRRDAARGEDSEEQPGVA